MTRCRAMSPRCVIGAVLAVVAVASSVQAQAPPQTSLIIQQATALTGALHGGELRVTGDLYADALSFSGETVFINSGQVTGQLSAIGQFSLTNFATADLDISLGAGNGDHVQLTNHGSLAGSIFATTMTTDGTGAITVNNHGSMQMGPVQFYDRPTGNVAQPQIGITFVNSDGATLSADAMHLATNGTGGTGSINAWIGGQVDIANMYTSHNGTFVKLQSAGRIQSASFTNSTTIINGELTIDSLTTAGNAYTQNNAVLHADQITLGGNTTTVSNGDLDVAHVLIEAGDNNTVNFQNNGTIDTPRFEAHVQSPGNSGFINVQNSGTINAELCLLHDDVPWIPPTITICDGADLITFQNNGTLQGDDLAALTTGIGHNDIFNQGAIDFNTVEFFGNVSYWGASDDTVTLGQLATAGNAYFLINDTLFQADRIELNDTAMMNVKPSGSVEAAEVVLLAEDGEHVTLTVEGSMTGTSFDATTTGDGVIDLNVTGVFDFDTEHYAGNVTPPGSEPARSVAGPLTLAAPKMEGIESAAEASDSVGELIIPTGHTAALTGTLGGSATLINHGALNVPGTLSLTDAGALISTDHLTADTLALDDQATFENSGAADVAHLLIAVGAEPCSMTNTGSLRIGELQLTRDPDALAPLTLLCDAGGEIVIASLLVDGQPVDPFIIEDGQHLDLPGLCLQTLSGARIELIPEPAAMMILLAALIGRRLR